MLISTFHKVNPVSTGPNLIAGSASGTSGFSNDTFGPNARFNAPAGIVRDGSANMYIADVSNHSIRKVTPLGVVTTFAGSGSSGSANGTGTSASFNNPKGLSIDSSSNLYVADSGNNTIRKITSGGVVTTLSFLVPGARAVSVNSNGTTMLAIDGGYGIHMFSNSTDFGTPFASGSFPNATSVALKPDGTFYYFPAPSIFQPTIPTNITTAYRVTFGSYVTLTPSNPQLIGTAGFNGQTVVLWQYSSNPGLLVNDIFTVDSNAFANEGGGGLTAYNGYVGQVWARNVSAANNIAFVYTTDGSKGVYPIGTPNASAYLHTFTGSNWSNIQAIQFSGAGNYTFIFNAGDPVPSSGTSISFSNGSNEFAAWNGISFQISVGTSNSLGGRASAFVTHSVSTPPSGGSNGPTNGKITAVQATVTSNYINLDGVYYGSGGASGFFYDSSQLFTGQGGCNITGYSLVGDTATTNYTTSVPIASNFIVKSATGDEIFTTNTTSNQLVSYSNQY